ncbi:MAG: Sensor protein, partial [Solirubrobacterales bacterium]|nr:Sensor protein [Solirubrobacterales bacterium]
MRLRSKLLLAQVPLAIALVLVGYLSRRTVAAMDRSSGDILKDNYLSVLAAQHMRNAADALDRIAVAHATGQRRLDPAELASQRAAFEQELRFQESNITEVGEREMTERLRRNWGEYRARIDAVTGAAPAEAQPSYFTRVVPALAEVNRSTDEILAVNQDAMVRKSVRARRDAERMNGALSTATIAAFLLGIFASGVLTTRLVRPLFILRQAARGLGRGDLAVRARIAGSDEIGQLARDFNAMADHLAEYRSSSLGELLHAQHAAQATI